jgi:hypothetical protein
MIPISASDYFWVSGRCPAHRGDRGMLWIDHKGRTSADAPKNAQSVRWLAEVAECAGNLFMEGRN